MTRRKITTSSWSPPPHDLYALNRARDVIVVEARALAAAQLVELDFALARLVVAVATYDRLVDENNAHGEARRAAIKATPTHLFVWPGDKVALCGDDSGLGGWVRFARRWEDAGKTLCPECRAAVTEDQWGAQEP